MMRSSLDRLILESGGFGLATPTLRLRATLSQAQVRGHLRHALISLFEVYGSWEGAEPLAEFELTITANLVLTDSDGRYGIWYGQDFSQGTDKTLSPWAPVTVQSLADLDLIQTQFNDLDFARIFDQLHGDSDARVSEVINIIYIFKRLFKPRGRQPVGRHKRLWDKKRHDGGGDGGDQAGGRLEV